MDRTKGDGRRFALIALCAGFALYGAATHAHAQESDEDLGLGEESSDTESSAAADTAPAPAEAEADEAAAPPVAKPAPPAPPPAAPPASPFTFILKGMVSGSMFLQDVPMIGSGGAAIAGPVNIGVDKWFLGGDIRQSRLTFIIKGPSVLGGATPTGVLEMDLGGYNYQITPIGGFSAVVGARQADGSVITVPLPYNTVTNEPKFDESLVPRMRLGYVELNWGAGTDIIRVGQYHNLVLGMIAGSASHISVPLGYLAGQLGYRSPGVTYLHGIKLSPSTTLNLGIQLNRNSWRDELPTCGAGQTPSVNNCLPYGVSMGEASVIPQVEARVMVTSGLAQNPLPFYAPTVWQAYAVFHYDIKDMSGLGMLSPVGVRDTMTTMLVQAGFKAQLGPLLLAANGWYGQNAGWLYGNIAQMQLPSAGSVDVNGFGAWGQVGLGITKNLSLWAFGGIDKPNHDQTLQSALTVAGTTRLQNLQLAGQLAYNDGPVLIGLELLYIATQNYDPGSMAMNIPSSEPTYSGIQPSITLNYNF